MLAWALLAVATAAPDWAPTVTARLDREEVHVGDSVAVHVTVIHRKDVGVSLPARPSLGKFTLLDADQVSKDLPDGRAQTDFVLRVAAYELGELEIPAIEVVASGPDRSLRTVAVGPFPLRVASLLANAPDPKPRPAAGPVRAMQRDWRLVWGAGLVAVLAMVVAATLWVRRRLAARARRLRPPPPPAPAHVIALRRLAELRASDLLERGEMKEYYERLSLALRDFFGARFGFDALDMTTVELRDALGGIGAPGLPVAEVEGLLSGCDLVKFARHRPDGGVARGALDEAVHLVERTRSPEAIGAI